MKRSLAFAAIAALSVFSATTAMAQEPLDLPWDANPAPHARPYYNQYYQYNHRLFTGRSAATSPYYGRDVYRHYPR